MDKHDITPAEWQKRISEWFEYRDGGLYWKTSAKRVIVGKRWGSTNADGYRVGQFHKCRFSEHQMVWVLHHAHIPTQIDHINGIRADNRIENLRDCECASNNLQNKAIQTNNKSGHTGVSWCKLRNKWQAHIQWSGKQKNLGRFDDINDAIEAYANAKRELHQFNPVVIARKTIYPSRN